MHSTVIVSYYTGDILLEVINKAAQQSDDVILVNNGNPEAIEKTLTTDSRIRFITGHGNIGFSKGCNLGASFATNPYILFLNPDCLIEGDTSELIEPIKNGEYWMSTCIIYNADMSVQKSCMRNLLTPLTGIGESLNLYKFSTKFPRINSSDKDFLNLPAISTIEALSGALIMISSDKFKSVGGFSEEYFLHVEDMDLCMKIKKNGGKVALINRSCKATHILSTSKTTNLFLEYHKMRGFIIYITKYFGTFMGVAFMPLLAIRFMIKAFTRKKIRI